MTRQLYPKAKEGFASGAINLVTDDIRVILIDEGAYSYNGSHQFLSSVPAGARIATTPSLGGKSVTDGNFAASNTVFSSVSGVQSEAILLYVHTGSDATARLLSYDNESAGLPVTPNGGDININWNVAGIFAL